MKKLRFETLAIHAGSEVDSHTGAIIPPIHLSTTFERDPSGDYSRGFSYSRSDNPNRRSLEVLMAQLEGGVEAAAFGSGSAAAAAVFRSLRPGDHALVPDVMYHGIRSFLQQAVVSWGVELTSVDMTNERAVQDNVRPTTRLIWVETPSNPMLGITDIRAIADIAHDAGAIVACDSTWTPPPLQPSLTLGADLTIHASTKYLAGHGDVMGGVVVARKGVELFENIRFLQVHEGAVPSPFDCWLTVRGIKTLPYRIRAQQDSAKLIALFLDDHASVQRVNYPGLEDHPGYEIARRQMTGFGPMLSFEVLGGREEAIRVAASVELVTRATSLGGIETLIEHRASIEGVNSQTPDNLLRLSVGLEHHDDILADLEKALYR